MLGQVWIQFLSTSVIILKSLGQVYQVRINTSVPHILVVYRVYALVIKYWSTQGDAINVFALGITLPFPHARKRDAPYNFKL